MCDASRRKMSAHCRRIAVAEYSLDSFVADNRLYRVMVHHNGPVSQATRDMFQLTLSISSSGIRSHAPNARSSRKARISRNHQAL